MSNPPSIKLPLPPSQAPAREKTCWQCGKTFHTAQETCPDDGAKLLDLILDDRDLLVGQTIDAHYHVKRSLAEGGMGKVYEAYDARAQREVAIKVLKADYLRDETIRKRFMHEARIVSNLEHPNVVDLYDFGQMPNGNFYMVMELLKGESLAERLANKFLTYNEIFSFITGVGHALAEAHARGVIHRDLKPENIFIVRDEETGLEQAKLIDFGVSKQVERQTLTQTGSLWGTPAYMSPEQCRGEQVTKGGDIYAMGIILYELVCGHLPFSADTHMGYAVKHMHSAPRPMKSAPGLTSPPDELDELVVRTLGKTAEDRPASMQSFVDDLEAIIARHFSEEESLRRTPALEVDPIALERWMEEGKLDAEKQKSPDPSTSKPPHRETEAIEFGFDSDSLQAKDVAMARSNPYRTQIFLGAGVLLLLLAALVVTIAIKSNGAQTPEVDESTPAPKERTAAAVLDLGRPAERATSVVTTQGDYGEQVDSSVAMRQGAMIAAHVAILAERILTTSPTQESAVDATTPVTRRSAGGSKRKNRSDRTRSSKTKVKKEDARDALRGTL